VYHTVTLLDRTKFDSSCDHGDPFKFKLGQGQTIKDYNQGMKTMKKGENAISTIPPEMSYEESGSPPKIPPNATLQFDLSYFHGPLSKIIAKMVAYLRRYLRMDRTGRTQRI